MNKDLFFGGRKIVDIWAGHRWSMVMDEEGELWSWGYNTRGNLGYPKIWTEILIDRINLRKLTLWNSYGGKKLLFLVEKQTLIVYILDGQGHIWSQ